MPYFIDDKNCVRKGTKEEPGEEVKCHDDHAAAAAHLKALYANVEDAEEKGGRGSGWHNPPEGTHTAENAPNFAGGPGADRKYGTESDEPPEGQRHCKCTKCDSTFTLPKGKQCKDVECPGCGGRATQTSPRRDKPAEGEEGGGQSGKKAMDAPGPTVHGEGGSMGEVSSVLDDGTDDSSCKCPKCGKGLPCTAKACPYCKEKLDRVERGDTDAKSAWTVYKSADGAWRWMTLSSWAVVDKEREVVSEQAYRDAIAYAQKNDKWGEMDLVHIDGTDVGDCDTLFIVKRGNEPAKFGAGGTWYDTQRSIRAREAIQAEPSDWGVSIKFRFNPQRKVRGIYTGDIQVLKHSILPQEMAASYGTAIAVQQGGEKMEKALDDKAAEALAALGHSEDEIAALAEKQKALPQEENVATKEDTTVAEAPTRETLWKQLGEWFGINQKAATPAASAPDEAEKTDEVSPAEPAEPAEKQAGDKPEETVPEGQALKSEEADSAALIQALGVVVAKSVGEMVKAELDAQDERISVLADRIDALGGTIEEKVEERLRDLPQGVKVAASQVSATAVSEEPKGLVFGQSPEKQEGLYTELVKGIIGVVDEKVRGAGFQV